MFEEQKDRYITINEARRILSACREGKDGPHDLVELIMYLDVSVVRHAEIGTSHQEIVSFLNKNMGAKRRTQLRSCKMGDFSGAAELYCDLEADPGAAEKLGASLEEVRGFTQFLLRDLVARARKDPGELFEVIDFIGDGTFTYEELETTEEEFMQLKRRYDLQNHR